MEAKELISILKKLGIKVQLSSNSLIISKGIIKVCIPLSSNEEASIQDIQFLSSMLGISI